MIEKLKWIVVILVLLATACTNNRQHEVGQYVYADCFLTIHVDRECASKLISNAKTIEERMAGMQGVSFIDTCKLTAYNRYGGRYNFCPRCVDDTIYHHLSAIIERNQNRVP